jgi:hypothetical protein
VSCPNTLSSLGVSLLVSLLLASPAAGQFAETSPNSNREIELELQTRDPVTGQIKTTREKVDSRRVGVIAVDVWNHHWCKTATMRVDAFVPRINKALAAARSLGMTVMLCPSDVVDNYVSGNQSSLCRWGRSPRLSR